MADASTPFWGLTLPEVGSSRDTWGSKLNNDLSVIDALLGAAMPIGAMLDFAGAFAPYGWLLADGTLYPIASHPKLFAIIGTYYGGDGVNNFAVPDSRARVLVGVGTTTDAAGVVGGFGLTSRNGFFQHTLSASELPAVAITIDAVADHGHTGWTSVDGLHAHGGATDGQGNHSHGYVRSDLTTAGGGWSPGTPYNWTQYVTQSDVQGFHAHNIGTTNDGNHSHVIWADYAGGHSHTGRIAGGGVAFPLYQPSLAVTKIIFAGPPGIQQPSAAAAPTALLRSPMRGMN